MKKILLFLFFYGVQFAPAQIKLNPILVDSLIVPGDTLFLRFPFNRNFYSHLDNTLQIISAKGKKYNYSVSNGKISDKGRYFIIRSDTSENIQLIIKEGEHKIADREITVQNISSCEAVIYNRKNAFITKEELLSADGIDVINEKGSALNNFKVNKLKMTVYFKKFEELYLQKEDTGFAIEVAGNKFTSDINTIILKCQAGDVIYFEYIKAVGHDNSFRNLSPVSFIIQ